MNPVASDNDQQLPLGLERGTSMHELMELDPSSTSFSFENEDIMMWEPSVSHLAPQESSGAVNSVNPTSFIFDSTLNMDDMVGVGLSCNSSIFGQSSSVVQPTDLSPLGHHIHFPANPSIPDSSLLQNTCDVLGTTVPSTGGVGSHMIPVGYSIFNTTAAAFDRLGPTQSEIGLTAPPKCLFQFTSPNQLHPTIQTGNTVETPVVGKPSALPDVAMSGYVPGAREPNRLPPARKGGRRGPLTEEQARHQKDARLRGICIRCRRTRIKCTGGIPCSHCLANTKSRIWQAPCVKAVFLDIVESGSVFREVSIYSASVLEQETEKSILSQAFIMSIFHRKRALLRYEPIPGLGMSFDMLWTFGIFGLQRIFYTQGQEDKWRKPTPIQLADAERSIVDLAPNGEAVQFPVGLQDDESSIIALFIGWFCTKCELEDPLSDSPNATADGTLRRATDTLFWICSRYMELCLFRRLQSLSNSPLEAVKDQKSYVYLILSTLLVLAELKRQQTAAMGMVYMDLYDRQQRVCNALWVYASITIRKLPAWSNFWQTLPKHLDIFSIPGLPKQFQASLSDFTTSINAIYSARFQRLREYCDFFSFVQAVEQKTELFADDGWLAEALEQNSEEIAGLLDMSLHNPQEFAGELMAADMELTGGVMLPATEEQRGTAAARLFGNFLSINWDAIAEFDDICAIPELNLLSFFLAMVSNRLTQVDFFNLCVALAAELGRGEESLELVERYLAAQSDQVRPPSRRIPVEMNSSLLCTEQMMSDFQHHLRCGRRWAELIDILGEAVVLIANYGMISRRPLIRLDISAIVVQGSDDEFKCLKDQVLPRCSWLKATCSGLAAAARTVKELDNNDDSEQLQPLARRISDEVKSAMGGRPWTEKEKFHSSTGGELISFALTLLDESLPSRSDLSEPSRVILDILVDSIWDSMLDLIEKMESRQVRDVEAGLSEALRDASAKFGENYRSVVAEKSPAGGSSVSRITEQISHAMDGFARSFSGLGGVSREGCSADTFDLAHWDAVFELKKD